MIRTVLHVVACAVVALSLAAPAAAWTERRTAAGAPVLVVERGRSKVIETNNRFATIALADAEIGEILATSDRSFFVRGLAPGWTTILVYDERGGIQEMIDLKVVIGLDALRADLEILLPNEDIDVVPVMDGVFIDGEVSSADAAAKAVEVAERHVPEGVANGLAIQQSQQVLLEVRFIEASRSAEKELSIGNSFTAGDVAAQTTAELISGLAAQTAATAVGLGGANIDLTLEALESQGIIRTLAEPNLIALSGDTASFLAGGEFPIPISNGDNGISVEFQQFGVSLAFTPTVLADGLVNIRVRPEVSTLDPSSGVISAGINVPALTVRRVDTTVELRDGQAFAIAGLLQNGYSNAVTATPWLSDVPVLGALFASRRYQRDETELVIIVTPRLVQPAPSPDALASPHDLIREPREDEFFLLDRTHRLPDAPES